MNTLRVLIDATPIPANRGGVGRYVDELVRHLVGPPLDVVVACHDHDRELFRSMGAEVITAPSYTNSTAGRLLWEQIGLPRAAKKTRANVIHSVHYTSPLFTRIPRVITIHDLTFFSHPQFHTRIKRRFFRTWIRLSARPGRTLVADSEATASAWHARFPRSTSTITVTPLGGDERQFHVPTAKETQAFHDSLTPKVDSWIAFLGTLEPRKNVPALIHGYTEAMRTLPQQDRPALLLAGGRGWDPAVDSAVRKARALNLDVRLLGYIPLEHLSAFLGSAELVVYPSFGEGFGLPVLEAMSTGAAVLTTRNLSLPEVGGDAVFYTDTDASSIARAIGELLTNPEQRNAARTRARERAKLFSWARTADLTEAAYRQAARIR